MRSRRVLAGGVAATLVAILAWPVLAAATLTVTPAVGAARQLLTATGSGFSANQEIRLQWDVVFLPETGSSDANGAFTIPFAIPADATLGGHVVRACIRGVCSQAVPFTVSVVAGTPPPNPTPATTATAPPGTPGPSEPGPSTAPSSAPSDSTAPVESPIASDGATPSDGSPAPDASATGALTGPSLGPTAVPADPNAPGTVGVRLPWDRIGLAALFGLAVLLIVVAAGNEKWFRDRLGGPGDGTSPQSLTSGTNAAGKAPKLYEAAKGTHTLQPAGDATNADPAVAPGAEAGADVTDAEPAVEAEPKPWKDVNASKDVKLKGKNIGEN